MDGPVEQPQEQTPASPDANWTNFVDQQTQKQQQDASDQKWQDFVQSHADQAHAIIPKSVGEVTSALTRPLTDAFVNHVLSSTAPTSQAQQTLDDDTAKLRNSKDFKEGTSNFLQLANDAVLKPAIQSFVTTWQNIGVQSKIAASALQQPLPVDKFGNPQAEDPEQVLQRWLNITSSPFGYVTAPIAAIGQTASKPVFEKLGATPQEAETMAQGFGQGFAQIPFIAAGAMRTPDNPLNTITRAKANGVLDGEEAYFGTQELPEEQQASINEAKAASEPLPEQPAPDIHQIARNLAPETFSTYDRLGAQQEALRGQLNDLQADRTADLDAQIKEIQEAKQGGYGKLQSLIAKRNNIIQQGDTPEMTDIRQKIQDLDYQKRDLAPQVSEAYRSASEFVPQAAEKAPETPEQPKTGEINQVSTKPLEEQKAYIANDISTKLTALGRPQEEADAVAQLEAARYETLASQYPKFSAEEWYNRESAELKAGKERARVLAQADYPTPVGDIPKAKNLSDIDRGIESSLADKVGNHFDDTAKEYAQLPDTQRGKILNTDSARELSEDYKNDRTKSAAVHEPASWFVKQLYAEKLKEAPKEGEDNLVTFTAGGTGAGKSSAMKGMQETLDKSQIIYDTNMNKYDSSVDKVEQALKAGKDVEIIYVYREPVDALVNGALPRAERMAQRLGTGRTVPLEEHAATHMGSMEVIEKLAEKYDGNDNVKITVIDNSRGQGNSTVIPLEDLPEIDHNNLHGNLKTALEQERTAGRISEETYQGFAGREKPENGGRSGSESELQRNTSRPNELEQASRGKIRLATDDAKSTITLMKNANASTLIHEKGHEWTDQLLRLSKEEDAPEQLKADAETLRKYGGVDEDGNIPTRGHEKIARGFERYLMEGTAPSPSLAGVFAKFKNWLTSIYQTVEKLRSPISDDIRDVFDRLLAKEPQKTVVAPDHEPGALLAAIHERDAAETPPEKAALVADNIRNEIKSTARLHDKETFDAITTAEKTGGNTSNQPIPGPTPANTTTQESSALSPGGNATAPESAPERTTEPTGKPAVGEQPPGEKPIVATETLPKETAAGRATSEGGGIATSPAQNLGRPKSYYVNPKGVINFDLFKTPEDIQNYLQEWADNHPDKISEARGGVATLDETVKLAQAMGMTPEELMSRKVGELYDGPKQVAAAQLFIQSAQRIKEAADAARASGNPQAVANFFADLEDHKDFHDMFLQQVGISAEASRALGARRAIRKLGGFQEAMDIGELFQRMTGQNLKDAKVQADLFASLETPEQISKMAQKTREANWFDYAIAYRNNNLLSGPVTHLHYADGNVINLLYKPLKVAVASLVPGGPKLGEAGAMFNSMTLGAEKGWEAAQAAWQDGVDKTFQETIENYKRPTHVEFNPTFDKFFGANSPVGRSIKSIHSFFYTMNYEQELAGQAFRKALSEGLEENTPEFSERISDLITNPTPEIMDYADKASKKSVYMAQPEYRSALGTFNQFANRTAVGRFLFPFAKMEMNVKIESLLNNTVLGLFSKDVRANLMGVNGPEARAIQIAGMTMGTSLAGLTWAASDYINGNGPSNPNQRKVWLLTHTPNSIQIGNVAIPLRALGNVGQILMAGAEIREAFQDMNEDQSNHTAAIFSEHASRIAFEGTFIQNAQAVTQAIFHPDQYGAQFLQNTASGFVPYATLLAQSNRYIDPFQREIRSEGLSNLYGITDYVKSRVPFASETLQERVDVLGNPIPNDHWLAAGSYEKYISDPVVQKLNSIGAAISKPKRDIMGVPLTDDQYHEYAVTAGQLVHQNLSWILQSDAFDQLSHGAQLKEVSKAIGQARKIAGQEIMFLHPEVMQQAIEKKEALYQ